MAEGLVKRGELVSDDIMLKILTNKLDTLHNQVCLSTSLAHKQAQPVICYSRGSLTGFRGPLDRERC